MQKAGNRRNVLTFCCCWSLCNRGVTDPMFSGPDRCNGSSYRNLRWPAPQRDCTMRTLMTEPSSIRVPGPATNPQEEVVFEDIAEIAACSLALRQWERQHLPTEASPVGFELLMRLAQWSALGQHDRTALLKQLIWLCPTAKRVFDFISAVWRRKAGSRSSAPRQTHAAPGSNSVRWHGSCCRTMSRSGGATVRLHLPTEKAAPLGLDHLIKTKLLREHTMSRPRGPRRAGSWPSPARPSALQAAPA